MNSVLIAILLLSQIQRGEIRLQVKDPSGAAMEASGTLEGLAAGISRRFETDAEGMHRFGALPFGVYRLEVEREGFSKQSVLIDVRSQVPVTHTATMTLMPVESSLEVQAEATLIDPLTSGSLEHLGAEHLNYRRSSAPGRSVIDVVNEQPGWLLEANGVLHPRGSEYDVQYVIDGIPLYDNRSPAFAQTLSIDDFETMTVRTAGYPAEFGRKLGGVIEVNTESDASDGWHGRVSLQSGSFRARSAFASLQYGTGRNGLSVSGEGMQSDRYLDPPVRENYTNHASGGGMSFRFDRTWSTSDSSRFAFDTHHAGFLVPNELLQQLAGQRQDRTADETLGQVSHTHLFSPQVLLQARAMIRETSARLWSNPLATPILPDQNRMFREKYAGGSFSIGRDSHEIKFGGDALFRTIHEDFGYRIVTRRINGVRIFDGDVPAVFRFHERASNRDGALFVEDRWNRGGLTVSGGLRFDRYALRDASEIAWSPRLGIAYYLPKADLVLRSSYDRVFQEPAIENILLATSDLVEALGGEGIFLPLKPARGYFAEAGFSKVFFNQVRIDGAWYRRRLRNFADDDLLLNTGISFPIAFRRGTVNGYETKIELPRWAGVSSYVSYTNMIARGSLPVAGGLFLGDDADEAVRTSGTFAITQDQRNTFRAYVRLQAHRKVWSAFSASYNSGLPVEIEAPVSLDLISQQYGPAIVKTINFERGRIHPSSSFDVSLGVSLLEEGKTVIRLQADVFNLTNRLNTINFSGLFSGTALGSGRSFTIRLNAAF